MCKTHVLNALPMALERTSRTKLASPSVPYISMSVGVSFYLTHIHLWTINENDDKKFACSANCPAICACSARGVVHWWPVIWNDLFMDAITLIHSRVIHSYSSDVYINSNDRICWWHSVIYGMQHLTHASDQSKSQVIPIYYACAHIKRLNKLFK